MRNKELFKLPFGDYTLTDGIYTYTLEKKLTTWGDKMPYYSLREKGNLGGGSVNFYEGIDDVFDNSSRYKQKVLTFTVFITGMSFSGSDCWSQLNRLKFVPKTSYKEWLKKWELMPDKSVKCDCEIYGYPICNSCGRGCL